MLKIFFWLLLAANAALFAYREGYLETLWPSGREPARMRNQINADKIKLIKEPVANSTVKPTAKPAAPAGSDAADTAFGPAIALAPPAPQNAPVQQSAQPAQACTEIGNFTAVEARRFETKLAPLALQVQPVRREVQETSSHMVMIPPAADKESADRQAALLRGKGIDDVYVIQENTALRWGISLGIFKTEEAARARMQLLARQGVNNFKLIDYKVALNRIAYQWRGLDARAKDSLAKLKADFPRQEIRNCS